MRATKKDNNHAKIGEAARKLGWGAKDVSTVANFCDWIFFKSDQLRLVECKEEGGTITEGNAKFMLECERAKTPLYILTDEIDVDNLLLKNEYEEPHLYYSKEAKKLLGIHSKYEPRW